MFCSAGVRSVATWGSIAVPNPLVSCYRAADGRWFWLLGLQGDRHWPDLVRAVDREELRTDARFGSMKGRREHAAVLVALLDDAFACRPLAEWAARFDRENVWWAPVQSPDDVVNDAQVRAAGAVIPVPVSGGGDGEVAEMVASPADFLGTPSAPAGAAPELGQHTEEILLALGYDWERIAELKALGAIP